MPIRVEIFGLITPDPRASSTRAPYIRYSFAQAHDALPDHIRDGEDHDRPVLSQVPVGNEPADEGGEIAPGHVKMHDHERVVFRIVKHGDEVHGEQDSYAVEQAPLGQFAKKMNQNPFGCVVGTAVPRSFRRLGDGRWSPMAGITRHTI
jgi:hypothetical protein